MCGEVNLNDIDKEIVLCGWAQSSRSLSQDLIFLPIRDTTGITQLVYRAETCPPNIKTMIQDLSTESVICIRGIVRKRPEGTINPHLSTGTIEVDIQKMYCLNPASTHLPFWPSQPKLPNEEVRLRHRYLDLRRTELQKNIQLRSITANTIRNYLIEQHQFTEIETPMLFKSTPEGAREFIVPTRKSGLFYALPQSPQQHKQMLMAAGFDRYFQIAKCFRDEDLRADRQPEFTQIDLEMSFVTIDQVQSIIEGLVSSVWSKVFNQPLSKKDFPHMTYHEAMTKYGSDKPDLRFDMQIQDMTNYMNKSSSSDHALDCLVIKQGASQLSGGDIKTMLQSLELTELEKQQFGYVKINENNLQQWPSKCGLKQSIGLLSNDQQQIMNQQLNIEQGDLVLTHQRPNYISGGNTLMGRTRLQLANQLQEKGYLTIDPNNFKFTWIESFPLFTPDEQGIRTWQATHHPFTAPYDEDIPLLATDPSKVRGQHYDLVLNGMEIGGGSIRIHSPVMQTFIFEKILELEKHEYSRFDHLIDALGGGCPPHGGIALGFDRLMSILCKSTSIRDVIAFPKAAGGKDFVVDSPSQISLKQLQEYGLKVVPSP
ncbi:unnamed protein product [Cunninghamella echinulata]